MSSICQWFISTSTSPQIFQGMNVRIGRIISEPDIEAQLAPNNLMSSHSIVYGFDNYTQTGIFTTTKIDNQWTIQAGISNGTDVALWQKDPGNQPTGTVMIQWTALNQRTPSMRVTTPLTTASSVTTICNRSSAPGHTTSATRSTCPRKASTCG